MIGEICYWPETIERWHKEGLPAQSTPYDYFGLDKIQFFSYDGSLRLAENVIEEDEETKIYMDGDGCKYKAWKTNQGAPLLLESSISEKKDWERLRTNLLADFSRFEGLDRNPIYDTRWNRNQCDDYKDCLEQDEFSCLVPIEPCWYYLRLLGEEKALLTMCEDPELVEEIISDYNDFNIKMVEMLYERGYKFDAMWVFSDLAYKNGMLFSPEFFSQIILPYQKRFFALCRSKGMKVIYHSDGNLNQLLPLLIEAGIDCIQPMEARAGNNVVEYTRLYGDRISFIGNINADILATDKEQIYAEISGKINQVKENRRYIFHSDHSIPPGISFENYSYAIELAKELGKY